MATIQEGIYAALKNDAGISAKVKVGSFYNIHPISIPVNRLDTCTYHLIYQEVTNRPETFIDLERPQFQITAVSDTYPKSLALRADVIRVLNRYSGNLGSKRDIKRCVLLSSAEFRTPDTKMYYVAMTFKLQFFGDNV
jgi:hypothetical protein